jgi:acyl carrier protein
MSAIAPSKDEILLVLKDVLSGHFELPPERIRPDAHLVEDLDLDSIDWIDLAVKLEMETGLKLGESELASIRTIQDLVDIIHHRLTSQGPTAA